jgi:CheY-like chemotaxis protein
MPSTLIVVAGPPLPGRWALARALARRVGARRFHPDHANVEIERALGEGASVVVDGDLGACDERARLLALPADERVLVDWICSQTEAHREIFHRYASRPLVLAERELERYAAHSARAEPVGDGECEPVVRIGARAPLADQVLRVLAALRPRSDPPPPPEERPDVLVVEDDPDQRALLADVLQELGCTVELAPDAGVALALLEDPDGGIDLVISDQCMPGMSGVDLAAEVARRYPEVRTAIITAHPDDDTAVRAEVSHVAAVLTKPIRVNDLERLIEETG